MISYKYDIINKITKCLIIYDNNVLIEDLRSKKYVSLLREAYYKLLNDYQVESPNSNRNIVIKCYNAIDFDILECYFMVIGIGIHNYDSCSKKQLIDLFENEDNDLVVSSSDWEYKTANMLRDLYSISFDEFIESLDSSSRNLIEVIRSIKAIDWSKINNKY